MELTKKQERQLQDLSTALFAMAGVSKARRRACAAFLVEWVDDVPVIISSGVNGTEPETCNQCDAPDLSYTYDHVIHAEINAIARCPKTATTKTVLLCTDSPCEHCLSFIRENTSIKNIAYVRKYRITDHIDAATDFNFLHLEENPVKIGLARAIDKVSQFETVSAR